MIGVKAVSGNSTVGYYYYYCGLTFHQTVGVQMLLITNGLIFSFFWVWLMSESIGDQTGLGLC